jgi:hypothetical protein
MNEPQISLLFLFSLYLRQVKSIGSNRGTRKKLKEDLIKYVKRSQDQSVEKIQTQ